MNQMTQIIANNGTFKPLYLYKSLVDNNMNTIKTYKSSKKKNLFLLMCVHKLKNI
ncbi:hypothetical protein ACK2FW_01015 [Clostridioides difficile]